MDLCGSSHHYFLPGAGVLRHRFPAHQLAFPAPSIQLKHSDVGCFSVTEAACCRYPRHTSKSGLGAHPGAAAAARRDGLDHEPGRLRLIPRVLDAPRHLKHAAARLHTDLAVSGASVPSHARTRLARRGPRALSFELGDHPGRVRRALFRYAHGTARRVGRRRAVGERGRGARAPPSIGSTDGRAVGRLSTGERFVSRARRLWKVHYPSGAATRRRRGAGRGGQRRQRRRARARRSVCRAARERAWPAAQWHARGDGVPRSRRRAAAVRPGRVRTPGGRGARTRRAARRTPRRTRCIPIPIRGVYCVDCRV